jgi:hypothetical protein
VLTIVMGNPQAVHHATGEDLGEQITTSVFPDDEPIPSIVRSITHDDGAWARHSAVTKPAWIETSDPALTAALVAAWGGDVPIGRPAVPAAAVAGAPGQTVQG